MSKSISGIISSVADIIDAQNKTVAHADILHVIEEIETNPFLLSYLRDLIISIKQLDMTVSKMHFTLLNIMSKRLQHFHHWNVENNETIKLINNKSILPDEIKPHVRFSDLEYEKYYEKQNVITGNRLKNQRKTPFSRLKPYSKIVLKNSYNHFIRKSHALNVIETTMGLLENLDIPINNKWLDVGCGNGSIANAVNSKRFSSNLWKIHGCDLQENRIKIAQNNARKMRYFYQENVLDRLQKNSHATNQYDIISMFEFCEHFVDPYSLLAEMSKKQFKLIVIATPLEQKFTSNADTEPDPAHLWSFSAQAWIKMLSKLNLKTIYHSEISVGQHTKGLNWLTVVAAKPQVYDLVNSI